MELKDKIKFALDESRMLILGGQVLTGFGYQSVFQPGFIKLPVLSQGLQMGALVLQIAALAVVMAPAARDCLVERGRPTEAFLRFTTRAVGWGLLPFAVGLGVMVWVAVRVIADPELGLAAGVATAVLAVFQWYGLRLIIPAAANLPVSGKGSRMELKDKIEHALTETRMVLPGVQAMLGFQFIGMLTDSFERLPASSKYVHIASLGMGAITIILLITPAAFHRLVERGNATERQHQVTTRFLLAAMVTLPPAITGDLFVVLRKVSNSWPLAAGIASGMLTLFYVFWFGYGLYLRAKSASQGQSLSALSAASQK